LQLLFIVFVLSNAGFGWPDQIAITVIGAGVLITLVVSGIDYVVSWARRARKDRQQAEPAGDEQ
jgi:heme/copper-type cytochrome/quinol oxidase subunit 2